jgi:uncharacterized protein
MPAMPQDTHQLIRNGLAAWSRGDVDGTVANFAPDIEFATSGVYPGLEPVYRGHAGFRRFWHDFRETWEIMKVEIERIIDVGEGEAVVAAHFRAAGRDGIPVERPVGMTFKMKDGVITQIRNFGSGEEALRAAGVAPPG